MKRSLAQWIDYIQTLHPRTMDLELERVARVWERFRPGKMPPVIAIAGTNGKGSSVAMLESVYRHAGYRTGTFTSPHLVHFNERIRLDNVPVGDRLLLDSFERIEALRGEVPLTFFEFNTLLALDIFCAAPLDIILLEVGLGGRLDAVNIVENTLALITSISIDHSAWLGDDRESIGREKAGIIKPRGRVVIADPQVPASVVKIAREQQAHYVQAGKDFRIVDMAELNDEGKTVQTGSGDDIHSSDKARLFFTSDHSMLERFSGCEVMPAQAHVLENMAGVIASVAMLADQLPVNDAQLAAGLETYSIRGRLQLFESSPRVLLDVSHNEASVLTMLEFIDSLQLTGRVHAVFGALADKDYGAAYDALKQRVANWYLCSLQGERGQSAKKLGKRLFGEKFEADARSDVFSFNTPLNAYTQARLQADSDDLVVIFGSFHLVGGILPHLEQ